MWKWVISLILVSAGLKSTEHPEAAEVIALVARVASLALIMVMFLGWWADAFVRGLRDGEFPLEKQFNRAVFWLFPTFALRVKEMKQYRQFREDVYFKYRLTLDELSLYRLVSAMAWVSIGALIVTLVITLCQWTLGLYSFQSVVLTAIPSGLVAVIMVHLERLIHELRDKHDETIKAEYEEYKADPWEYVARNTWSWPKTPPLVNPANS